MFLYYKVSAIVFYYQVTNKVRAVSSLRQLLETGCNLHSASLYMFSLSQVRASIEYILSWLVLYSDFNSSKRSVKFRIIRACLLYEFTLGSKAAKASRKICIAFWEHVVKESGSKNFFWEMNPLKIHSIQNDPALYWF